MNIQEIQEARDDLSNIIDSLYKRRVNLKRRINLRNLKRIKNNH